MSNYFASANTLDQLVLPELLLTTKFSIPPLRPTEELVNRSHLITRLNEGLSQTPSVMIVSAPPGFGKTTLLTEWLSDFRGQKLKSAWLSLDENDNDPHRFLIYAVAALQTLQPEVGQRTLALLRTQGPHPPSLEALIVTLINDLVAIEQEFIFVFDDYQVIQSPIIHNSLAFFLDHLPRQTHLVIASRTIPPFSLARLRGQGRLIELHTNNLRLNQVEGGRFLNQVMGLNLSAAEVAALESRTEGWIAGLQMAAISMKGLQDTASFVRAFTGSHRHILDYLSEEILNRQPAEVQRFLLYTSILNRLTGRLCEAVLSGEEGERGSRGEKELSGGSSTGRLRTGEMMLQYLEQANLFLVPLDHERRWYRYHHLFADLLRRRLEQTLDAQKIAELHRRAADWHEQQGLDTEAMSHAMAAVDVERVIRLAKQKAVTLLSHSELVTMLSWLDVLPEELTRSHPQISLFRAWALLLTGQLEQVEAHLQEAERQLEPDMAETNLPGETTTIRAGVAYFRREMSQAIELYHQALGYLSPDDLYLRGIVMQCLGGAYGWSGQMVEATRAYTEAYAISQTSGNLQVALLALWNIARLQVERGHLHEGAKLYRQTLEQQAKWLDEKKLSRENLEPIICRVHISLAELMLQWNDLEAAHQHIMAGLELGTETQESGGLISGYLVLAQIKEARGEMAEVIEAIQQAEQWLNRRYTGSYHLSTQVAVARIRLGLLQGKSATVLGLLQEFRLQLSPPPEVIPYLQEELYLSWIRVLLDQKQEADQVQSQEIAASMKLALVLLDQIIVAAKASERITRALEALILEALFFQAQDNLDAALTVLKEALPLAEAEGYVRLFVEEGPAMAFLLRQALGRGFTAHKAYLVKLLAAFEAPVQQQEPSTTYLLESLSERELELLRLMATGMSNRDIADKLFLTVGTVKWHLNNIYSKLDVRNRTQAVARARALKLL